MSHLFPKWMNHLPTAGALAAVGGLTFVSVAGWYYLTPDFWRVGYQPKQTVAFSHQIHAGQLGMDCRYCHTHVEESYHANVPATSTCMNCHTVVNQTTGYLKKAVSADGASPSAHWVSKDLALVRESYDGGRPIEWRRIHKAPDYVHFPHSAHLKAGISCYSCHSRIDEMPVVYHAKGLGMGWCLDCHRQPEKHLIDTSQIRVTDLRVVEQQLKSPTQIESGKALKEKAGLLPPQHCGACHY